MKRLGLLIATLLLACIAMVVFAYAFGVPQHGDATASTAASPADSSASLQPAPKTPAAPAAPAAAAAPTPAPVSGVAPLADPSAPLAIELPGCVCHSKDPKLVKQHAAYRMNQCAGCHVGGAPTGR